MRKSKKEKIKVKEIVAENLSRMDKVKLEYIIDVIRPFYSFTKQDLIDKELKRKARYIMGSFRDSAGVSTYFADDEGFYINVEQSEDMVDLGKVNRQLNRKYAGLTSAMKKVKSRVTSIVRKLKEK